MTDPHISTRDKPGDYDAIETLKPGEPVFPVQGGDPIGPATVLFWADEARKMARRSSDAALAAKLFRKAAMAEEVAWAMQAYQRGDEVPAERRALYGSDAASLAQIAAVDVRRSMINIVGLLNNALSVANDCATQLGKLQQQPEAEVKIHEAVALLREAVLTVEPRRANERS